VRIGPTLGVESFKGGVGEGHLGIEASQAVLERLPVSPSKTQIVRDISHSKSITHKHSLALANATSQYLSRSDENNISVGIDKNH
jgi:hypothetical protein